MATQKIINDIKGALKRGKPIPSGDVRALLAICEALAAVIIKQQGEITTLRAALPKPDAQQDPHPIPGVPYE